MSLTTTAELELETATWRGIFAAAAELLESVLAEELDDE